MFEVHCFCTGSNLHHFSKTNCEPGLLYCQINVASLPIPTLRMSGGFTVKSPKESEGNEYHILQILIFVYRETIFTRLRINFTFFPKKLGLSKIQWKEHTNSIILFIH